MAGLRALFDTVILIDALRGVEPARLHMLAAEEAAISIVTWIEVMSGVTPETEQDIATLLSNIPVIPISLAIARQAAVLRRERRFKLPDAMILATAQVESYILLTRNTKDFAEDQLGVRIPYRL